MQIGKDWGGPALCALTSRGIATASPHEFLRTVCYSLWVSWTQPCCLSKLGVLGHASHVGVLKDRVLDLACNTFAFQEETRSCTLIVWCCAGGWDLQWECLSIPFPFWCGWCGYSVCLMCRSCSASFQISFRENCSVYNYRFCVSMAGDEFKRLLWCYHEWETSIRSLFSLFILPGKCYL